MADPQNDMTGVTFGEPASSQGQQNSMEGVSFGEPNAAPTSGPQGPKVQQNPGYAPSIMANGTKFSDVTPEVYQNMPEADRDAYDQAWREHRLRQAGATASGAWESVKGMVKFLPEIAGKSLAYEATGRPQPEVEKEIEARQDAHKHQVYNNLKQDLKNKDFKSIVPHLFSLFDPSTDDPNDPIAAVMQEQWNSSAKAKANAAEAIKKGDWAAATQHIAGVMPFANDVDSAMSKYQEDPSYENLQQVVSSALPAFAPSLTRGVLKGAKNTVEGFKGAVEGAKADIRPVTKEVGGTEVPVSNPSILGKVAKATVNPDIPKGFAETQTAPAVAQGIGEIAKEATGSEAKTTTSEYDPLGIKGHAESLIEDQSRPAWQYIDKLSDGKMSEVQNEISEARLGHDQKALDLAYEHRDALYDTFRDDLKQQGMDVDQIDANYRKGKALEKIARRFDKPSITGVGENGGEYSINGKGLRNEIQGLIKDGETLDRAGIGEDHIAKWKDLADTLKSEQAQAVVPKVVKGLARLASVLVFGHEGGITGAMGGLLGESVAEQIGQHVATKMFGNLLMSDPAPITEALKNGDTAAVEQAVQQKAASNPTWLDSVKAQIKQDFKDMFSGTKEGQRGSLSLKKRKGATPAGITDEQVQELKKIGMTDDDISQLKGSVSGGSAAASALEHNASGESAASVEAQNRLRSQQGDKFYRVDARKANVSAGYTPMAATVDRVDMQPGANEHIVRIGKNGEIETIASGDKAGPLPPDERLQALAQPAAEKAVPQTADNGHLEIGTRRPSAANSTGLNNPGEKADMDAIKQAEEQKPGYTKRLVESLLGYENSGFKLTPEEIDANPQAALEKVINHLAGNLEWLHNQIPENIRNISKQWYDSAHVMTKKMADKYGIPHEKMAAVVAALSPKNGWDNNVGQADRLVDHWTNGKDHEWSPEMDQKLSGILANKKLKPEFRKVLNTLRDKTYGELTAKSPEALLAKKGLWLRILDEAHNGKDTPVYAPDGSIRGHQTLSWGMPDPVAKAIAILEGDGSVEHINSMMGEGNKIRNFYNNIINPNSKNGHVTIDTHAVNADMLKPMGSNDAEVLHNFGGAPGHAGTGLSGSYAVHAEAYQRAAERLGLKPRELQSITWEGIKSLMGDEKKTAKLKSAVKDIWKQHEEGTLTLDQARDKIVESSGGFSRPPWLKGESVNPSSPSVGKPAEGLPSKDQIVDVLRQHPLVKLKGAIKKAYAVGSQATGTHGPASDLDVLLETDKDPVEMQNSYRRKLQQHFMDNDLRGKHDEVHPQWNGRRVDVYFTNDASQETRPKVELK